MQGWSYHFIGWIQLQSLQGPDVSRYCRQIGKGTGGAKKNQSGAGKIRTGGTANESKSKFEIQKQDQFPEIKRTAPLKSESEFTLLGRYNCTF